MNLKELQRFNEFKEAVITWGYPTITIGQLYTLLNRFTYDRPSYHVYGNMNARLRYYRFWIKMLVGMRILQDTQYFQVWSIHNEKLPCVQQPEIEETWKVN